MLLQQQTDQLSGFVRLARNQKSNARRTPARRGASCRHQVSAVFAHLQQRELAWRFRRDYDGARDPLLQLPDRKGGGERDYDRARDPLLKMSDRKRGGESENA